MSLRIMSACWPLQMSSKQKLVLVALADQASDDGVCWPSAAHVASRTGLSERSVRYAIDELAQLGHLQVRDRPGQSSMLTITPCLHASAPLQDLQDTPAASAEAVDKFYDQPLQILQATPADSAPTPANPAPTPADSAAEPINNRQETSLKQTKDADDSRLPDWLPETEWAAFVEMRVRMKAPLTDHATRLAIGRLEQFRRQGYPPADVLNASILNGWRGLFKPKPDSQGTGHGNQRFDVTASARAAEARAIADLGVAPPDAAGGDLRPPIHLVVSK